jgi:hypothetical protein
MHTNIVDIYITLKETVSGCIKHPASSAHKNQLQMPDLLDFSYIKY